MESVSDSRAVVPVENSVSPSDLSILIEDLRGFAFDDDSIQKSFESAVKDFEDSRNQIEEIRANKKMVIEKLHQQYDDHKVASETLDENAKLFEEIQQLLSSNSGSPSSSEELEFFVNDKLVLEEAIEKYQSDVSVLERQHSTRLEDMKNNHDMEQNRLKERKRSLESQIQTYTEEFERQKAELKIKHDRILETLSEEFRTRLSQIEELKSHKQCESELETLRSSWNETLQGLAVAIERTRDEIRGSKTKKRRTTSNAEIQEDRNRNSSTYVTDSQRLEGGNFPFLRECTVVIEPLEEIPDCSDRSNQSKSTEEVSSNATIETDPSLESSPSTSSEHSAQRKRLFTEQQVQENLGTITETTPHTIEAYLRSLQRIVSENTKEQKRQKRKKAP